MMLDIESRQLLQDSARDWFLETCPVTEFRARRDFAVPVLGEDLWSAMVKLGWSGMLVPEALGGSDLGLTEMALILEQSGRHFAPVPLLSTSVGAVTALSLACESALTRDALVSIVSGELRVALAFDEGYHHQPLMVSCVAERADKGWVLSGRKTRVADISSNAFLVSALVAGSVKPDLFLVPAELLQRVPTAVIDSRDHGDVVLDQVRVEDQARLVASQEDLPLLSQVLDRVRVGLAAEMLGTACAAFDMTIEYLKIREQFGQVLGSFQALQHRLATLYVELEVCRSVLDAALQAADEEPAQLPSMAAKAKALIGDTLNRVTSEAIQLHGGIGMTDEHDAGLYLKRARVLEQLYGNAAYHRDRFASLRGF